MHNMRLVAATLAKLLAVLVMSGLLVFRHRKNIANLLAGKEGRIGGKKDVGKN